MIIVIRIEVSKYLVFHSCNVIHAYPAKAFISALNTNHQPIVYKPLNTLVIATWMGLSKELVNSVSGQFWSWKHSNHSHSIELSLVLVSSKEMPTWHSQLALFTENVLIILIAFLLLHNTYLNLIDNFWPTINNLSICLPCAIQYTTGDAPCYTARHYQK